MVLISPKEWALFALNVLGLSFHPTTVPVRRATPMRPIKRKRYVVIARNHVMRKANVGLNMGRSIYTPLRT